MQTKDDVIHSLAIDGEHIGFKEHPKSEAEPTPKADASMKRLLTNQPDESPDMCVFGSSFFTLPSTLQKLDLQCFRGNQLA